MRVALQVDTGSAWINVSEAKSDWVVLVPQQGQRPTAAAPSVMTHQIQTFKHQIRRLADHGKSRATRGLRHRSLALQHRKLRVDGHE